MIDISVLRAAGLNQDQILKVLETEQTERKLKVREQSRIRSRNYRERIRNEFNGGVTQITRDVRDVRDATPLKEEKFPPAPPSKEENTPPVPTSSDANAVRDIRADLFRQGLKLLALMTGRTPDSCRSLVGKMLKVVDDEAIHVLGAIEDAHRNQIADPVPWIWQALNSHSKLNGGHNGYHRPVPRKSAADVARELVERTSREASFDFDRMLPQGGRRGP